MIKPLYMQKILLECTNRILCYSKNVITLRESFLFFFDDDRLQNL